MGGCLSANGDEAQRCSANGDEPQRRRAATQCRGATVKPLVDRRGTPFATFLEEGHLAVVSATYFEDCLHRGVPFQDRANIPAEAIIDGQEVVELWEQFGCGFLVIVSYPWLSKEHPDPDCYHLPRLVRALKAFGAYHDGWTWRGEKQERVRTLGGGVILDFCCFWQGMRTADQNKEFKEGLELIHIPYGHQHVTALKLTSTPPSEVRLYDDRGWTHFESTVIDSKTTPLIGPNVLTCGDSFLPQGKANRDVLKNLGTAVRKPPLTPLRFCEELEARKQRTDAKGKDLFTNGADNSIILDLYDKIFAELCRQTKFDFRRTDLNAAAAKDLALALPHFRAMDELLLRLNHCDCEALETLAGALPRCTKLSVFNLSDSDLGASGQAMEVLAAALPHCAALSTLVLMKNNLGGNGQAVEALAAALPRCTTLKRLFLGVNDLGARGQDIEALAAAWHVLELLDLRGNNLGGSAQAVEALASAFPRCTALTELNLSANNLGASGQAVEALASAFPRCTELRKLDLGTNNLGASEQAVEALAIALPRCSALRELDLWDPTLEACVEDFAAAVPHCPALVRLNLNGDNLVDGGQAVALEALAATLPR